VVSLLTGQEPEIKVHALFSRLQTPAETGNPAPYQARSAAEEGKQLLLVNLLHPFRGTHGVGFLKAYRVDLTGFAIGWALAVVLVLGTSWMFQSWGK
jgi:hypothetical protein